MKIAKQTAATLTVKSSEKTRLLFLGIGILAIGLVVVILIQPTPLGQSDLRLSTLFYQLQEGSASFDVENLQPSVSAVSLRLAYYVGRLTLTRERPGIVLAVLGVIAGAILLLGPFRSRVISFDKSTKQVKIKRPRWFFRSATETYPMQNVSEIRVERDRAHSKRGKNFGVNLIIGHSEGTPLTRDYIHYKTVYPISETFRYTYDYANGVATEIRKFLVDK